jgi:hypothetical protein
MVERGFCHFLFTLIKEYRIKRPDQGEPTSSRASTRPRGAIEQEFAVGRRDA